MKISVVIPVFNSEKTISELISRIENSLKNYDYEIICVDDLSIDRSWRELTHIKENNEKIKIFRLLKNYGQHTANLCGFKNCSGDVIVTLDDDLQNPPEEIEKLIEEYKNGYELVYGSYKEKKHNLFRRLGSKFINYLIKVIFEVKYDKPISNFRVISKKVINRVISESPHRPYIPGLILKNASSVSSVIVSHAERAHGKSNYTISKILNLISDLIFSHSYIPINLINYVGILSSSCSLFIGLYLIIKQLYFTPIEVPGWTSLAILILFIGGLILLSVSLIGQYLIRTLKETSNEEHYIVQEKVQ